METTRNLRVLPNTGTDLSGVLLLGNITQVFVPITQTTNTDILFSDKYYSWRYDGKDFDEDDSCVQNPQGEHYMEELRDDADHPYTENYVSIGHCPYGKVGDSLLINGVVVDIIDIEVHEASHKSGVPDSWEWLIAVKLVKS